MRPTYFTICSANYLAYARTLHLSLKAADPDAARNFHVVLVDEDLPEELNSDLPFPVVLARDLGIANFWDMAMRYTVMEFNTAVKPDAIQYFMDQGADSVIYLDPDIYILKALHHVEGLLAESANLVLTPHALAPLNDGCDPDDLRIIMSGAYNLGFCAFKATAQSREFLSWWARHLEGDCRVDLEHGLFVDQKFMDLAPAYLENTHILRHRGYNAAYWNLNERPVTRDKDGTYFAGGDALHFFHFSGVIPGDKSVFSKHQNRFSRKSIGKPLTRLLDAYLDQIEAEGHAVYSAVPYGYARYTNGHPISDITRKVYGKINPPAPRAREMALAPDVSFLDSHSPDIRVDPAYPVTQLMKAIYESRPDLQQMCDLTTNAGRELLGRWLLSSGVREYGLPPDAVHTVSRAVAFLDSQPGAPSPVRSAGVLIRGARSMQWAYRHLPTHVRQSAKRTLLRMSNSELPDGDEPAGPAGPIDPDLPTGICVIGNLACPSGVGEAARRTLGALKSTQLPVSAHVVQTPRCNQELLADVSKAASASTRGNISLIHMNADQVMHIHQAVPPRLLRGRYRIGFWAWELVNFPEKWAPALEEVHEVWTPSEFTADAIRRRTDKPVHAFHHPAVKHIHTGLTRANFNLPEGRYAFLCSFDLNSYSSRKNPTGALRAFRRAFPRPTPDGPILVMKFHGEDSAARNELLASLEGQSDIYVIDETMSQNDYAALQDACDAYISLHRSEGFGMNIAECMARGKIVIATDFGGSSEYLGRDNGLPVNWRLRQVKPDEYPHTGPAFWAEPDLTHAADCLQLAYKGGPRIDQLASCAQETMRHRFCVEAIGSRMKERLLQVLADF